MACDGAGDVNVFLSPRVGFTGEPPAPHPHPPTSLLTFADMVIALDSRGTSCVQNFNYAHLDSKLKADHTYASVENSRIMTRSQSLRSTLGHSSSISSVAESTDTEIDYETDNSFSNAGITDVDIDLDHSPDRYRSAEPLTSTSDDEHKIPVSVRRSRGKSRQKAQRDMQLTRITDSDENCDKIVKRSSSFENVQSEADLDIAESSSEWPPISKKHIPRKSCSFEEVNHDVTSQKRVPPRGGSSGQLHRLVNDTLEFPCWPRKADHTYATATWDGTAASHSLFEQEMRQEIESPSSKTPTLFQNMEVTETYILPVRSSGFENFSHQGTPTLLVQNMLDSNKCSQANQKDDHTYVKPNTNIPSDGASTSNFSFATFPRQKTRDDHTYFHSGMIKRGSGATGGKEWASSHSVSDLTSKKEQHNNLLVNADSSMQSVSTKKDHNYSSSS